MSQNSKILAHLQSGAVIDPNYALRHFGCSRLSARIHELRNRGHKIHSDMVGFVSRTGRCGKVAMYWMERNNESV